MGTVNTAPIDVFTARRYSGSAHRGVSSAASHAERGDAPQDQPRLVVSTRSSQHGDPPRAGEQVRRLGQRPPVEARERAPVHRVPGGGTEHLVGDRVDGRPEPGVRGRPLGRREERPRRVPARERPPDRRVALGDEQPLLGLERGPQLRVAEVQEVAQPGVAGVARPALASGPSTASAGTPVELVDELARRGLPAEPVVVAGAVAVARAGGHELRAARPPRA